ncbi:MAG: VOC family protein [Mucilaginibacter polytrichastri]|nr:VOC family protein [Mucilaginibacter polytrichastri]
MKIALASVYVNDVVKAHAYYTETLGFNSRMFMPEAHLAIVIPAEAPEGTALLLEPNENPIAKNYQKSLYDASIPVITMGSSEIHAEHKKLSAKGVTFRKEPTQTDFGIEAIFEDTCGNLIQMYQV